MAGSDYVCFSGRPKERSSALLARWISSAVTSCSKKSWDWEFWSARWCLASCLHPKARSSGDCDHVKPVPNAMCACARNTASASLVTAQLFWAVQFSGYLLPRHLRRASHRGRP